MHPLAWHLPVHLAYLMAREAVTGNAANVSALVKGVRAGLHERMGRIPTLDADFLDVL
jgi:hypothetical protein